MRNSMFDVVDAIMFGLVMGFMIGLLIKIISYLI